MAGLVQRAQALRDEARRQVQAPMAALLPAATRHLIVDLAALVVDLANEVEGRANAE